MFSLFKKMFAKQPVAPRTPVKAQARTPRVVATGGTAVAAQARPQMPVAQPQVAVAQLSLAAILQRFPEDLRPNIANMPDASVTVALPVATIQKQLAAGAVKMSLASLYRQAPAGTFHQTKLEEKRMVEVPLSEVMRHVDVQNLRRRSDQRRVELPKSAPALFGDSANPYVMAPSFSDEEELEEAPSAEQHTNGHAAVEMPEVEDEAPLFRIAPRSMPAPAAEHANGTERHAPPPFPAPAGVAPRQPRTVAPTAAPASTNGAPLHGSLMLPLSVLCDAWPEPIRSEALALGDAQVAIPAELVAGGLGKGRIAFSWGQIRSYITPTPIHDTQGREGTELLLPLKVVAPAFMALSKPASRRRSVEVDESIPDMFGAATPPPAPAPAAEAPAAFEEPAAEAAPAPEEVPAPAPAPAPAKALKFVLNEDSVSAVPEPEPSPAPAPEQHPAPTPVAAGQSIGELFGQPDKAQWSVQEIVDATAKLPGVAGAVLALQEGLPVAASLPPDLKSETLAAFIPQIFARLNVYAGEMKLAAVDEILMTTNGAHFQAYRMGSVYFAVIGQQGGALPWEALRIVVDELVKQSPA